MNLMLFSSGGVGVTFDFEFGGRGAEEGEEGRKDGENVV